MLMYANMRFPTHAVAIYRDDEQICCFKVGASGRCALEWFPCEAAAIEWIVSPLPQSGWIVAPDQE